MFFATPSFNLSRHRRPSSLAASAERSASSSALRPAGATPARTPCGARRGRSTSPGGTHSHAPRPAPVRSTTARPSAREHAAYELRLRSPLAAARRRCARAVAITRQPACSSSARPSLGARWPALVGAGSSAASLVAGVARSSASGSSSALVARRLRLGWRLVARRRSLVGCRLVGGRLGSAAVGLGVPLGLADHGAVGGVPLHLAGLGVGDPLALGVLDALVELLAARRHALGELGLGADVDAHAGEAGGEAGVLALPADRQAELVVGHDHVGLGAVVADDAPARPWPATAPWRRSRRSPR